MQQVSEMLTGLSLSKNPSDTEVGQFFEGDARDSLKIINHRIRKRAGRHRVAAIRHGYTLLRV